LNIKLFKWRPILRGIFTLTEYDNHYSLIDVLDAHEALDVKDENENFEHAKAERAAKAQR